VNAEHRLERLTGRDERLAGRPVVIDLLLGLALLPEEKPVYQPIRLRRRGNRHHREDGRKQEYDCRETVDGEKTSGDRCGASRLSMWHVQGSRSKEWLFACSPLAVFNSFPGGGQSRPLARLPIYRPGDFFKAAGYRRVYAPLSVANAQQKTQRPGSLRPGPPA